MLLNNTQIKSDMAISTGDPLFNRMKLKKFASLKRAFILITCIIRFELGLQKKPNDFYH